jgi:hypothetical protein
MIFFRRSLVVCSSLIGIVLDSPIRIESANGTVGLLKQPAALFKERLDLVDELLFVKLLFRLALCFVDNLYVVQTG